METRTPTVELLFERTEDYSRTLFELAKLRALETTTDVVTSMVSKASVVILASLFVLVFNVGVALLVGDLLGKSYYGFFIVAAFYLLAAMVAHFFLHQWIKRPVGNLIISEALQSGLSWKR